MASSRAPTAAMASSRAPAPARPPPSLTPAQVETFQRDGFLVLEDALTGVEVSSLKSAAEAIIESFDFSTLSVFTTEEQTRTTDA
jgi:phytanoyl-CoA hydroxylase